MPKPTHAVIDGIEYPIEATLRALDRSDCEDSLYTFLQYAWRHIDPSPFVPGWPLEAICEHLQAVCDGDIRKLIINIPPRCSKSTITSVAFPAWVWAQRFDGPTSGPGTMFLHASYAQQLSLRDSVKCRRLIESPWYQSLWGDRFKLVGDQNTKTRFDNNKKGSRLSTSVGSALTGEGGSCFVAGTMVSTPDGNVPIEELKAGDAVWAFDSLRGKVVKSRVVATAVRTSNDLYKLHTVSGRRFVCTGNHPVFSPGRGYIRADQLGIGDGLLIEGRAVNHVKFDLRQLRETDNQAALRSTQGTSARQQGRILQQEMLFSASCGKACQALHNLFKTRKKSSFKILFRRLQSCWPFTETQKAVMSSVRCAVRWLDNVLFVYLRGRFSFPQYAWEGQFKFQKDWTLLQSIYGNEKSNTGARSTCLRGLWGGQSGIWEKEAVSFACASYQRELAGQSTGELDYALRELSQAAPSWETCSVKNICRLSSEPVRVYDIQVEAHSNFFADGVLVHNCIIVDDPNAAQEAFSEATIETTIEWWDSALSTRLNDPKTGAFVVIQQRLSEEDLTGHILEKDVGAWTHLCLPMRYEPDRSFVTTIGWQDPRSEAGELLWPERFGEDEVKTLERQLGPYAAAGQLQQRPEPKGGGIVKREWWQLWEDATYPPLDYVIGSLDTAYTTKTENDFSALSIWGVFSGDVKAQAQKAEGGEIVRSYNDKQTPKVMLMFAWQERLELHELILKVADSCKMMKVDKLLIENKAAGHSVAQEIRRLYSHENFYVQLYDPKGQDKLARLYSVQHLFAEGMIFAPDKAWAETVISQVGTFPKGKHDDLVDTVSMSLRHLRDLGMLTRGPEAIAEVQESMQYVKPLPPLY